MNWFRNFMYGRYGSDHLNVALILAALLLSLAGQLSRLAVPTYVAYALAILCIFRLMSRNYTRRQVENAAFMKLWRPVAGWLRRAAGRLRDLRNHRYLKCPDCRRTLRVPRGKGKIRVTCPMCKKSFDYKS